MPLRCSFYDCWLQGSNLHEIIERCWPLQRLCVLLRWSHRRQANEIWNFKARTILRPQWKGLGSGSHQSFPDTILEVLWKIQYSIIHQRYLQRSWSFILDPSHRLPYRIHLHDLHETFRWTPSVLQYSRTYSWNCLRRLDGLPNLVRHGSCSPTLPVLLIWSIYNLGNRSCPSLLHSL